MAARDRASAVTLAIFGGGLLGFEIGAGLAARLPRRRDDGGHRRSGPTDGELVAERPILGESQISVSRYRGGLGIIIGRINAFEIRQAGASSAEVVDVEVAY